MRKKMIIAVLAASMALSLAACGTQTGESVSSENEEAVEDVDEADEAEEGEETEEIEEEVEEILLLSDDNIELTYTGCDNSTMYFTIENKTDVELTAVFYSLSLNGISYGNLTGEGNSKVVQAGETAEWAQAMPDGFVSASGNVTGDILYLESDDSDDPIMEKKTFAAEDGVNEPEGVLLFSDSSVSVYYDGADGKTLNCLVVNKTQNTVDFAFETLEIAGQSLDFLTDDGYDPSLWIAPYSVGSFSVDTQEKLADVSKISGVVYYCDQTDYAYSEEKFSADTAE